jgi:hypothetical protein
VFAGWSQDQRNARGALEMREAHTGMRVKWTGINPDHGTIVKIERDKFWVQWDSADPDTGETDPLDYSLPAFPAWRSLKPL